VEVGYSWAGLEFRKTGVEPTEEQVAAAEGGSSEDDWGFDQKYTVFASGWTALCFFDLVHSYKLMKLEAELEALAKETNQDPAEAKKKKEEKEGLSRVASCRYGVACQHAHVPFPDLLELSKRPDATLGMKNQLAYVKRRVEHVNLFRYSEVEVAEYSTKALKVAMEVDSFPGSASTGKPVSASPENPKVEVETKEGKGWV
jgi:hypothetical protein